MAGRAAVSRHSRRRVLRQSRDAHGAGHAVPARLDRALDPAQLGDHGADLLVRSGEPVRGAAAMSALVIIFATMALALWLGVQARRRREMTLEQWTVGGRGFGTILVFVLMAGEIYTTFTFLGGSGFAYG